MEYALSSNNKLNENYCKHCDTTISGGSFHFKAHLFGHKAVKARFKCEFCLSEYFRLDTFKRHVKSHFIQHGNKKYYTCDCCGREFICKRSLIGHFKVHDNIVHPKLHKYTCSVCEISYCELRILKIHIRKTHCNINESREPIHSKKLLNESWFEPVLSLNECVKMTKINNNGIFIKNCAVMKADMLQKSQIQNTSDGSIKFCNSKTYTDATCDYCNKVMLKKSLRNHIRERHLNVRKFTCIKCKSAFKRRYQLTVHNCK